MTTLKLSDRPAAASDVLVLGLRGGDQPRVVGTDLSAEAASHLEEVADVLGASSQVGHTTSVAAVPGVTAPRVVLVGVGDPQESEPGSGSDDERGGRFETETLRRAAGSATRSLGPALAKGPLTISIALPARDVAQIAAVAGAAHLGTYSFTAHKSSATPPRASITIVSGIGKGGEVKAAVARAGVVADATTWARDLVNTAPNLLYPQSFTDEVKARVKASPGKVTIKVLDDKALTAGGFGGIVGVGQGSSRPPRIVVMSYTPGTGRSRSAAKHVALVGKGITFDTGGVCIKPASGMATMKSDMAGAAAVAASVLAAAELEIPVQVTGYLCLAENMPGGNAQRPGDVVTMRNGMTVEILDTDAEGRMVLGDGMALAAESAPDAMLDIATLTGACVVALGTRVAGVMGNDDEQRDAVVAAGERAGEASWPLPLPEDLRAALDSPVADIAHKGDRWGGALTAGLFLREFAKTEDGGAIPWTHVDIAGPSFNDSSPWGHTPKGGTGFGVATILGWIEFVG